MFMTHSYQNQFAPFHRGIDVEFPSKPALTGDCHRRIGKLSVFSGYVPAFAPFTTVVHHEGMIEYALVGAL
jgi:hypothetical protein